MTLSRPDTEDPISHSLDEQGAGPAPSGPTSSKSDLREVPMNPLDQDRLRQPSCDDHVFQTEALRSFRQHRQERLHDDGRRRSDRKAGLFGPPQSADLPAMRYLLAGLSAEAHP